jgi:PilZ domain
MRNELRSDRREPEKVRITVSGINHNGLSFEEKTETIDLSSEGLSFYLNTPIFVRTFLSLTFNDGNSFGYSGKLQVLVVRIDSSRSGKQLVAVQIR